MNECGPELREGGQALPTSSGGFWPQQALGGDGNKGLEGKAAPLDNGGETGSPEFLTRGQFQREGRLQSKLWPRVGVEEWGPWLGWGNHLRLKKAGVQPKRPKPSGGQSHGCYLKPPHLF